MRESERREEVDLMGIDSSAIGKSLPDCEEEVAMLECRDDLHRRRE